MVIAETNSSAGNSADVIKAELSRIVKPNPEAALTKFSQAPETEEWIKSEVADCLSEGKTLEKFEWLSLVSKEHRRTFRTYFDYAAEDTPTKAKGFGWLQLTSWNVNKIILRYDNESIAFWLQYKYTFNIICEVYHNPDEQTRDIGERPFYEWHKIASVPLPLLRCWMSGYQFGPDYGIEKPKFCDEYYIQYGSEKYPTRLHRLIRGLGQKALDVFLRAGYMPKEVFELAYEKPKEEVAAPTNQELPTNSTEKQPAEIQHTTLPASRMTADPQSIENKAIAVQISKVVRERLEKASHIHEELSLSQWGELWDITTSPARDTLLRFEREGLATLTQGLTKGTKVDLTEKGIAVLKAF